MNTSPRLAVMVRAPHPGRVKTRLAAGLGDAGALAAYRAMLDALAERLGGLDPVEFRVTPDGSGHELAAWRRPGWSVSDQGGGDLGTRLARTFADAFRAGHDRVAVIGSDCPAVSEEDVRHAWGALDTADVVLGPASDGGYWLVALRGPAPAIFEGVPWSTPGVLEATRARAREAGMSVALLRELEDIDTVEAWQAWRASR